MGKKHSKQGGGTFQTLKRKDVPAELQAKVDEMKIMDEQKTDSKEEMIDSRLKEFITIQKEYHNAVYNVAIIGAELETFIKQSKLGERERSLKWNGMIMPISILLPRIGLHNIKYKEGIGTLNYLEKALRNKGLSEEEIKDVGEEGKFVKKIPTINEGKEAPKVNKG